MAIKKTKHTFLNLALTFLVSIAIVSCNKDGKPKDTKQMSYSFQEIVNWDGTMLFNHPDNPYLKEIPTNASVHPNSKEMIDSIKVNCGTNYTNTYVVATDFSLPIYFSSSLTELTDITINLYPPPGKNKLLNVPLVDGCVAAIGSDRHLAIINQTNMCAYEFWLYKNKKAGSGNAISLTSNGIYKDGRSTVAAGWSQLQGVIWPKELQDGEIKNALSYSIPVTNAEGFVYSDTHNDGALRNNPYAIPEGTLIRIKSDIDVDTIADIGPIEKIIYKAIQKYGMYCGDTNGAGLGIRAVSTTSVPEDAYPSTFTLNENNGAYYLSHFPFEHLEVIYTSDLQKSKAQPYINHGCAEWE